jgi:pimeloyl-ACP methyl ester carboxylesterase
MPFIDADAVRLYYEEAGSGVPVVFAHEFGGNLGSWETQLRHLSRSFRCIAYNARGYPPSDVPAEPSAYSQRIAGDDLARLLTALDIDRAHIVGLSMGSVTALDFALRYGERARSITLCGCGYGSIAAERAAWLTSNEVLADGIMADIEQATRTYANGPTRLTFKRKDPRGWQDFVEHMATSLDPLGASLTLRGIQAKRPSLHEMTHLLREVNLPAMIVVGDEDTPALEPSLFLKKILPHAALWVFPLSGHAVNAEEPHLFNRVLFDFLAAVDLQR